VNARIDDNIIAEEGNCCFAKDGALAVKAILLGKAFSPMAVTVLKKELTYGGRMKSRSKGPL
jgi:hypothetical protein